MIELVTSCNYDNDDIEDKGRSSRNSGNDKDATFQERLAVGAIVEDKRTVLEKQSTMAELDDKRTVRKSRQTYIRT